MNLLEPQYLADAFALSEVGLLIARRSRADARSVDFGSLRALWIVIFASVTAATLCYFLVRFAHLELLARLAPVGIALFVFGLIVRWYSIIYLGRFFTVNVAVAADHYLVDTGPYRWLRHPSYAGLSLLLLGLGLSYSNWLSLLLVSLPPLWVLRRRIKIEEAVLRGALGDAYVQYCARTRRLIPFVY
jgi:protein-S-isoprenylcysteine O-methyltransferase